MKFLRSGLRPLPNSTYEDEIQNTLLELIRECDSVDICVGYASKSSLKLLDQILDQHPNKVINISLGMYYSEGIQESIYHEAMRVHEKWTQNGNGQVRIIRPFSYHGKSYVFYKDGKPFAAVLGSANLSVLKTEAKNRRQFETAILVTDDINVQQEAQHVQALMAPNISVPVSEVVNLSIIKAENTYLEDFDLVTPVTPTQTKYFAESKEVVSFFLPLKVPDFDNRFMDDGKNFTKSNINVCYANPRNKHKNRDWFEMQLTVSSQIYRMEGYPEKNKPFFIITDDEYMFKAHTTSDNNKQFSAVGDELIMGRWLKGRLAAAGLVEPVNDIGDDPDRLGMITNEILDKYGCHELYFKKTDKTEMDENGDILDVWYLSFDPKEIEANKQ